MEQGRVTVFRYNPEVDKEPHYETYEFPYEPGMSVLDVAMYIYENIDGSFTFSYCCRNSHCGLCSAKINGVPGLMCRESATQEMTLEPLDNLSVVRDLMVDRNEYEDQMVGLRLFLERVSEPVSEPETIDQKEHDRFKIASRCVECYSCLSVCTVFKEDKHEFLGPAGIVQLARHAFDPRDELNREVMAYSAGLYNCTLCGKCTEVCPHSISPRDNIELLRARLIDQAVAPRAVNQLIEMVKERGKAIIPPQRKAPFLEEKGTVGQGKVGLFVGCTMDYDPTLMPVALSAVKVLLKLGVDLAIPAEQVCCGTPLTEVGSRDQVQELVLKNVEAFEKAGCSKIVTLCSACGLSAKTLWPEVYMDAAGRAMPFEVQDFTEFLVELPLSEKELHGVNLKVTYHDPCSLKRGQGIFEEPRQLLREVPELKLEEMPEADYCCGGGGGLRMTNFDMSKRILKRKLSFVKEVDIEAIVTCCPICMKQLKVGLSQEKMRGVNVLHLANVMADAIAL